MEFQKLAPFFHPFGVFSRRVLCAATPGGRALSPRTPSGTRAQQGVTRKGLRAAPQGPPRPEPQPRATGPQPWSLGSTQAAVVQACSGAGSRLGLLPPPSARGTGHGCPALSPTRRLLGELGTHAWQGHRSLCPQQGRHWCPLRVPCAPRTEPGSEPGALAVRGHPTAKALGCRSPPFPPPWSWGLVTWLTQPP